MLGRLRAKKAREAKRIARQKLMKAARRLLLVRGFAAFNAWACWTERYELIVFYAYIYDVSIVWNIYILLYIMRFESYNL